MKAVPHPLTDSVVGIWFVNLVVRATAPHVHRQATHRVSMRLSGVVHVLHRFCVCGVVLTLPCWWRFSIHEARWSACWNTHEEKRATNIQIRGDWAEFCERLGFSNVAEFVPPCFCCAVPRANLYDATGASVFSSPHLLNDDVGCHGACERCELLVRVTQDHHRRLSLLLRYDKRQKGARGLSLAAPFHELELRAGDRLEPCSDLPDVGASFSIPSFAS